MSQDHEFHIERLKGKTIIKDDTLARQNELKYKNRIDKFNKNARYFGSHSFNIFSIILILLIGIALIRILYSGSADTISFGSLLDILRDVPQVSANVKNFVMQIGINEPWLILDGFRVFLNGLLEFWSILIWLCSSIIDVIIFIGYFLTWVFI